LEFVFSLTESLFRSCSKNADFVLVPVSFCTQQKQTQTLRKYQNDEYNHKIRTKGDTGTCNKIYEQMLYLCKKLAQHYRYPSMQ
jgi:hypothetical protein